MASVISSLTVYFITWIVLRASNYSTFIGPADDYKFRVIIPIEIKFKFLFLDIIIINNKYNFVNVPGYFRMLRLSLPASA